MNKDNTSPRRRRAFRLAAMASGIAASLLILEIVLHFVWGAPRLPVPPGALRNDPATGTAYRPNYRGVLNTAYHRTAFRTNGFGFRDRDRNLEKPPGVVRVLAIGDSYVEGFGVPFDETFLEISERALNRDAGSSVELPRAGVGGWGPVNEYRYLTSQGHRFEPDGVLVVFFTGNDYTDLLHPDYFVAYDGIRLERSIADKMTGGRRLRIALRKRVYLYGWLVDTWKSLTTSSRSRYAMDAAVLGLCRRDSALPMDELAAVVDQFQDWARGHNRELAYLILPHRAQVESGRADHAFEVFGWNPAEHDLDRPSAALRNLLDHRSIPYYDFTDDLREWSVEHGAVGMRGDDHYNARVHAFLGARLAGFIADWLRPGGRESIPIIPGKPGDTAP